MNDIVVWYVDGVNVGSVVTTSNSAYGIANDVFISTYIGVVQAFPGVIDEVAVYTTALTASDIARHSHAAQSTVPEPSTVAIWSILGCVGLALGYRRRRMAA